MKSEANHYLKPWPSTHPYLDIIQRVYRGTGLIFKENWHENMQFYYLIKGTGLLRCESDKIALKTGDLAIINGSELHSLESRSEQLSCFVLRLDPLVLLKGKSQETSDTYTRLLIKQRIVFQHLIRDDRQMIRLLDTLLEEEQQRKPGFEWAIESTVFQMLVQLVRYHIKNIYTEKYFNAKKQSLNQLKRVIDRIDQDYCKPLSIDGLAREALMSEAHFCRTFKKLYGKTPIQYVNSQRIEQAKKLLISTTKTITEVALSVGFNDANYFSRVFKQYLGISPQKLRNRLSVKAGI